MTDIQQFSMDDILSILPHRPPFLFVERVVKLQVNKNITAEYTIKPDEVWFKGHFPEKAIMPGVLITDACAQTSGLLWGLSRKLALDSSGNQPRIFLLAAVNIKFIRPAFPGDVLTMHATCEQQFSSLYTYSVEAMVGRRQIVRGSLTLAMMDKDI